MDPSHSVDKTPNQEEWESKEGAGEDDIPHPVMPPYLLKEVC